MTNLAIFIHLLVLLRYIKMNDRLDHVLNGENGNNFETETSLKSETEMGEFYTCFNNQ
jgi:hypothetical protein